MIDKPYQLLQTVCDELSIPPEIVNCPREFTDDISCMRRAKVIQEMFRRGLEVSQARHVTHLSRTHLCALKNIVTAQDIELQNSNKGKTGQPLPNRFLTSHHYQR